MVEAKNRCLLLASMLPLVFLAPISALPTSGAVDRFRTKNSLRSDVDIPMVQLRNGAIKVGDAVMDLEGAPSYNVYADESIGSSADHLSKGTADNGRSFLVVRDVTSGQVTQVSLATSEDGVTAFRQVEGDWYGEISVADVEESEESKGLVNDFLLAPDDAGERRSLQSSCEVLKDVLVAVAYDSSFCQTFGGSSGATLEVERIVAEASLRYEVDGLCLAAKLSALDGFCDSDSDPYTALLESSPESGCNGNTGRLQLFSQFWNRNRQDVQRHAAHLFTGSRFTDGPAGCAYEATVCGSSYAYGVNSMAFLTSDIVRTILFAHELGHNL